MPTNHVRTATDDPKRLEVQPVKLADSTPKRGRPKTNIQPRTPQFELEPDEQTLYATFMESFIHDYPDIKDYPSDMLLLPLAAVEYIKYLRVIGQELTSRQAITMARQHPATQFFRILDMMHVTRKARAKTNKPKEDDETTDFLKALSLDQ
jgi:hypothetical protein